jgi:hypothetical protein
VVINCNFIMAEWGVIPIGSAYNCWSKSENTGILTIIEEVRGTHQTGKSNVDVLNFREDGVLQYIPTNLVDYFPNLKGMLFYEQKLLRLIASDLKPFPNLVGFYSRGGLFTSIEGDLFQHTKKIQRIDIQVGKLQNVGENILSGLNELTVAWFVAHPCIYYQAATPEQIQELKQKLLVLCPPLTSTTTISTTTSKSDCSLRCSLEDEFDEMKMKLEEQGEKIARQEYQIMELEKMIREIVSRP